MKALPYLAASALLFSSCAPVEPEPPTSPPMAGAVPVDTVCFTSGLSGFSEVADDALLLRRSPGDEYIVRLGFCPYAKSAVSTPTEN